MIMIKFCIFLIFLGVATLVSAFCAKYTLVSLRVPNLYRLLAIIGGSFFITALILYLYLKLFYYV